MRSAVLAVALSAALAQPALAQSSDALAAIEARMQAMEAELAAARAEIAALKQAQAETTAIVQAAPAPAAEAPAETVATTSSGNEFNPTISLVLDGKYRSNSPNDGSNGLSLGESELTMSANIDDKFYGQISLALESEDGEDEVGIEEAFIDTLALPNGLALRAGRFFSGIGYLNNHHLHTDSFADRPLAYEALLGGQYGDDGVQLRWVAPTDLYFELGAEIFRGQSFPSGGSGRGGTGVRSLFAKLGGDIGDETSWLAGLAALDSRTEAGEDGFRGDNRVYVADATWKWAPQGNFKDGGLTLRGEYVVDDRDGDYIDPVDPALDETWNGRRDGAYVEAIYRINRQWEAGYRFDRVDGQDAGPDASNFDPTRHSIMLAWRNSEYSLLRLQLARHQIAAGNTDSAVTLQYQVNLGAHGAHKF